MVKKPNFETGTYDALRGSLAHVLEGSPYWAYSYSYPHKTAYRPLEPPVSIEDAWRGEDQRALFLYVHIPFCEMRCGFCNLFTMAKPRDPLGETYVSTLRRQAELMREALDEDARFVNLAIGGGTPTQLDAEALDEVFRITSEVMGADLQNIPVACEVSPETTTPEKLDVLRRWGVDRVSIGVQSFLKSETRAARRPQEREVVHEALTLIRDGGFPLRNIDLIYGLPGQTPETWQTSLEACLTYAPEEIFLYPLYVRPLTGLGNARKEWDDARPGLYAQGRDFLLANGYTQRSMRMFCRAAGDAASLDGAAGAREYRCQRDGMVGLGVGARSYTDRLHYATEYAVGRRGVVSIIEDFVARDDDALRQIQYGIRLDEEERQRRHLILSLLSSEGLDLGFFRERFGAFPFEAELEALREEALVAQDPHAPSLWRLTTRGMSWSDAIGPWLYSAAVRAKMDDYELR